MNILFRNALRFGVRAATNTAASSSRPSMQVLQQSRESFVTIKTQSPCVSFSTSAKHYSKYDGIEAEKRDECILTYDEFKKAVEEDQMYLIDVREQSEIFEGKVPAKRFVHISIKILEDALKLSSEEFQDKFDVPKPDPNDRVVFMCTIGIRSTLALRAAEQYGFKNSKHYLGGWNEWSEKHLGVKYVFDEARHL